MKTSKTIIRPQDVVMADPETLWKTRQVALALGVSVSTVKRWVDSGSLRACRTVGRHRLIAPSEVARFSREHRLPGGGIGGEAGRIEGGDPGACDRLVTALRRGRAREARALIDAAYAASGDASALADGLIRPAMGRIGDSWEHGDLDVFQEHRASRIVESAIIGLIHRAPVSFPSTPLALGASPEKDLYTLPGLLAELTLREQGWEVVNLGPNLPMASLARAVRAHQPRMAWLSVNHLDDPPAFLREYPVFYEAAAAVGAAVILGGQALGPELRARLVYTSFGERLVHLRELARRLHPGGRVTDLGTSDLPNSAHP